MKLSLLILMTMMLGILEGQEHKTRFRMEYENVFNDQSEVTAVFISCEKPSKLKLALRSFLFFNTIKLRKLIIIYCV